MARTTVDIDPRALAAARASLGTTGVSNTVNAALRESARRAELAEFDVVRDIDGEPGDVALGREERAPVHAA